MDISIIFIVGAVVALVWVMASPKVGGSRRSSRTPRIWDRVPGVESWSWFGLFGGSDSNSSTILQIHRITARSMMVAFTAPPTHHRTADISVATAVVLMVVEAIIDLCFIRLTQRWSQQSLQMATMLLEFMNGLSYTTIIELAEPLAGRRGSVLSR